MNSMQTPEDEYDEYEWKNYMSWNDVRVAYDNTPATVVEVMSRAPLRCPRMAELERPPPVGQVTFMSAIPACHDSCLHAVAYIGDF